MAGRYRMIYGLAKSQELQLSDDDLHAVVFGVTGKDSLKALTDRQIELVVCRLRELKDGVKRNRKRCKNYSRNGRRGTEDQRKKIFMLMNSLSWNENRVRGLAKRLFKIEVIEWLDYVQCSKLIEAMKAMAEREEKADGQKKQQDAGCAYSKNLCSQKL